MAERDEDQNNDISGGDPRGNGDIHGTPDATLGGYMHEHSRPPAFEGADGEPYTVSIEIQKTGNLFAPYEGYLVFPRWASTGLGVIGHVETDTLLTGRNRDQVEEQLAKMSLVQVKLLLDRTIEKRPPSDGGNDAPGPDAEGQDPAARKKGDDAPND